MSEQKDIVERLKKTWSKFGAMLHGQSSRIHVNQQIKSEHSAAIVEASATITTLREEVETLSNQTSWIVGNGDGTKWRCWRDGFSRWTTNRDEAVRYARREDAEAAHAEDEDAWLVEPFVAGNPLIAERDAAIARATKAEAALAKMREESLSLENIILRYCDKERMSNAPAEIQQFVDGIFSRASLTEGE